jgi:hypothetical protein
MRLLIALVIAAFVVGCGDSNNQSQTGDTNGYNTALKGTAAGQVIEDLTGYTDVKAGRRAAVKIKAISAQERKDYNEAADMNNKPQE